MQLVTKKILLLSLTMGMLIFGLSKDLRADTLQRVSSRVGLFTNAVENYFKPAFKSFRGSTRSEQKAGADLRSAINRFFSYSFGGSFGTGSSLSPEEALRIRQKNDPLTEAAIPFSSDDISELNVNAPSLFKEQTQFRKDIFLQGDLTADGQHIELGVGTLSASNVLYGMLAGDGISITGSAQRPTISALFWRQEGDRIRTRVEELSLGIDKLLFVSGTGTSEFADSVKIGGNLLVSGLATSSFATNLNIGGDLTLGGTLSLSTGLHFTKDVILQHDGTATIFIPGALQNAWHIATTTQGTPLFSVSTQTHGGVSFGTSSNSAFMTVVSPDSTARLFVGTNNSANLYISNTGLVGIGTTDPSSTLSVSGTFDVTDATHFGGEADFEKDIRLLTLTGCTGESVLETDSEGRIICGQDDNTRKSTSPGGTDTQVQFNKLGGFGGSSNFTFNDAANVLTLAGLLTSTGSGTSTFNEFVSLEQLHAFDHVRVGGTSSTTIYGSATSTFGGGIFANAFRFNQASCTELVTDSTGGIICGTDDAAGSFTLAGDSGSESLASGDTISIKGGKNLTVTVAATDTATINLDSTLYSLGNIFATSSGNIYASSTIQATGNIIGYNAIALGTTTPYRGAKALIIDQAAGENYQNPLIYVGDNGTSTPFFFITQKGVASFGSSSPTNILLNPGDVAIGRNGATSDLFISGGLGVGNATTTDSNIELAGKLVSAGNISGLGHITLTGSGTSTYTGGIFANAFRFNQASCTELVTDSTGGIICGTDDAGADGNTQTLSILNNVSLYATSTNPSGSMGFFVRGAKSATTSQDLFEVAGDATIHDRLTANWFRATSTLATSTIKFGLENYQAIAIGGTSTSTIRGNGATSSLGGLTANHLTLTKALTQNGGGTSTFTGGIFANAFRFNQPSCTGTNALNTDSGGGVVCGAVTLSAAGGWTDDGAVVRLTTATDSVGIGTTTPGAVLAIANRAGLTDKKVPLFTVASSTASATTTLFTILNTGNVGIGTTNPQAALHASSSSENVAIFSGLNGRDSTITLGGNTVGRIGEQYITYQNVTTGASGWMVGMGDDEDFYFDYTTVGEIDEITPLLMIERTTGNVGIGTTTPWGILSIEQAASQTPIKPTFVVSDNGTSTPFFFITQKGVVSFGSSSPTNILLNPGDVAIGRNGASSDAFISGGLGVGNATTTDTNIELAGKLVSAGNISGAGHITLTGSGTSTYTGGIFANALRFNQPSCSSALETDSDGSIVCGTDGGNTVFELFNNVGIYATTTGKTFFVRGALSATTSQDLFEVAGDAKIHDSLTVTSIYASSTIGALDFFATSSGASFYASSTVQGANLFAYTNIGIGGTTSPAFPFSLLGRAFFNSKEIRIGTTSAANTLVRYYSKSTTTIPTNTVGSFVIATSTDDGSNAILTITTGNNRRATTSLNGALLIDNGAFAYNSYQGVTYADALQTGPMAFDTDAGILSWVNVPVSTTTTGLVNSYSAQINETSLLTIYSETEGGGSARNRFVGIGSSTPWGTFSIEQATTSPSAKPVFVVADTGTSTPHFIINPKGWIGVGTSSPGNIFQIAAIRPTMFLTDRTAGSNRQHFFLSSQEGGLYMGTSSNSNISTASSTQFSFRDSDFAVHQGSICVDDDGSGCPVNPTVGRLYAINATVLTDDLAELMRSSENLSPGDIVMVDPSFENKLERSQDQERRSSKLGTKKSLDELGVKRTTEAFEKRMIGVISTKPGITLGGYDPTEQDYEVTLTGRIPVKVSTEAGPITAGDRITSSSLPGVGMSAMGGSASGGKAGELAPTIGIALEDFDGSDISTITYFDGKEVKEGKIIVLLALGYAPLDPQISGGKLAGSSDGLFIDQTTGKLLPLGDTLDLGNTDIINVRGILSANGSWSIDENGNLKVATIEADKVKTKQLEVGSADRPFGTTLYDVENGQPYCAYIKAGALETVSGTCEANSNLFGKSKTENSPPSADPDGTIGADGPAEPSSTEGADSGDPVSPPPDTSNPDTQNSEPLSPARPAGGNESASPGQTGEPPADAFPEEPSVAEPSSDTIEPAVEAPTDSTEAPPEVQTTEPPAEENTPDPIAP